MQGRSLCFLFDEAEADQFILDPRRGPCDFVSDGVPDNVMGCL